MTTRRMNGARGGFVRRPSIPIVCVVLIVLVGVLQTAVAQPEANKAIGLRGINEVWSQGDLAVVDEIIATDYVYHEPAMGEVVGPEGLKQAVSAYRAAYPDLSFVVDDIIAEDDLVVIRWTASGTQQGELMGIPATGLATTSVGMNITRYRDGKAVEEWTHWDVMGLMQQLGVNSPPRPGPENYQWGAPSSATGDPGDPEANKALVHRLFDGAITGNFDIIDELMVADYLFHDPVSPVEVRGPEGYKQEFGMYLHAFPDIQITFEQMIAEGDKVAIRWTLSGTHEGTLMGVAPTGTPVTVTGISMYRVADGKFVETWASYDAMGMMQQLAAPPTWPIAGAWITNIPIPDLGVIVGEWTVVPQDTAGLVFTSEIRAAKPDPTIFGSFPDCDHESDHIGTTRWTASLAYESTWIGYGTKQAEMPGLLPEVVYISVLNGRAQFMDRNTLKGEGTHAFYLASQDTDGDGFPDKGEEPVACFPYFSTARRVQLMPPCVPPPPEVVEE